MLKHDMAVRRLGEIRIILILAPADQVFNFFRSKIVLHDLNTIQPMLHMTMINDQLLPPFETAQSSESSKFL
jgi:hypothetical protein